MRWMLALACACGGSKHSDSASTQTCEVYLASDEAVGSAPWDGAWLRFDARHCDTDPLDEEQDASLVMSDGTQVAVTSDESCGSRYTAPDGLPAGEYVGVVLHDIVLDGGEPQDLSLGLGAPFTVAPFGHDPAFNADDLDGRAFLLDPGTVQECHGLGGLLADALPGRLWLQLGASEGEKINLALVQEVEDQEQGCVYLQPRADLTATGELTWQTDHLVLNEDPAFDAWDVQLHLALDATAEQAASVELTALVDVANLVQYDDADSVEDSVEDWEHTCALAASFGLQCQSCPESDRQSCLPLHLFAAQAALSDQPWELDTLPECGELLGYDTPEVDWPICEPACSATSPSELPLALIGLLGLTLLRRREDH